MDSIHGVRYLANEAWAEYPALHFLPREVLGFLCMLLAGAIVLTFVMVYGMVAVWLERKIAGHVQDRLGPMRVGWHGWLQSLADGVKLALKEDIIPKMADKPLFVLAPCIAFLSALVGFAVLPFGEHLQMADLDVGVLFILAISSLSVIGVIMAGWASNSKWPLYGAMRSAALNVSYEVPLALSILPILMVAGSLGLQDIIENQVGGVMQWNFFRIWPWMPLAFVVFFISALAETNRVPFDIAEAESELVGGYHTEYSGIMFSLFFIAEYAAMFLACGVAAILFFGGYLPPQFSSLGMAGIPRLLAWLAAALFLFWRFKTFFERRQHSEAVFCAILLLLGLVVWAGAKYLFWFLFKSGALLILMLWLRWTLPRLRIDQMMYMCWKVLTPLAFINILGTGLWWMWRY